MNSAIELRKYFNIGAARASLLATTMIALMVVPATAAETIFDNGVPNLNACCGDVIGYGASPPQLTADDFVLHAGANEIGSIHWWGGFNPSYPNDFTILTHEDDQGVPSSSNSITAYHGAVSIELFGTIGGLEVFSYAVDLVSPITLTPGTTYWLQIMNGLTYTGWSWSASDPDIGIRVGQGTTGIWSPKIGETAFFLTDVVAIPEPSTALLVALGLTGLGLRGRVKQS